MWSQFRGVTYDKKYIYPAWAQVLGLCMALSSMVCIPIYFFGRLATTPGTLQQVSYNFTLQTLLFPVILISSCWHSFTVYIVGWVSLVARASDSQSEKVGSNLACALKQGSLSCLLYLWTENVNGGPVCDFRCYTYHLYLHFYIYYILNRIIKWVVRLTEWLKAYLDYCGSPTGYLSR